MSTPTPIHPEPHVIPPSGPHTHTLILLHGTSTSAPHFALRFLDFPFTLPSSPQTTTTLRKEFSPLGSLPGIKLIFPSGTLKKIGALGGVEGHAWFNVHDFSDRTIGEEEQVVGMSESVTYLRTVVEDAVKEVGIGKVILGGFSQGCAMGMIGVLSGEWEGLGAFWGLSGWLGFRVQILGAMNDGEGEKRKRVIGYLRGLLGLEERDVDIDTRMPMLLGHGDSDPKVKFEWGVQMKEALREMGVEFRESTYEGIGHWYSEPQMRDFIRFFQNAWNLK